ncbi:hypothetical protein IJH97_02270 [Candidatus Saccharibacteria bacterium]|nr:hypothetical protein [Candidatus Saccharibacteria bacterium]
MPEPKKQSSARKTGLRRSHLRLTLARAVNKKSPVKAFETAKKTPRLKVKTVKPAKAKATKAKTSAKTTKSKKSGK